MNESIWKMAVPVMNEVFYDNQEETVRQLKQAGATLVCVAPERSFIPEKLDDIFAKLQANLDFLADNGMEACVWIQAFGFGVPLTKEERAYANFTPIREIGGRDAVGDAFCPEDPAFMQYYRLLVQRVAKTGVKWLMLDDDLCLSVRPGIGCACERHLKKFKSAYGKEVDLKTLFCGAANEARKVWLKTMGDTLTDFCKAVRAAADEINPELQIGFCAGYTSFDFEGTDAATLSKTLAGKHRPFLRLSAAPYWTVTNRFNGHKLPTIVEFARLQAHWYQNEQIDLFSENDSYPRPRYIVPSAYIESYEFCLRAATDMGHLKYLMDYHSVPGYENGYLEKHLRNAEVMKRTSEVFDTGVTLGVCVHEERARTADMDFTEPFEGTAQVMFRASFSAAAAFLAVNSIPITYEYRQGMVTAAFGDAGRTVPKDRSSYILDYIAALKLAERGVDTGVENGEKRSQPETEVFTGHTDHVFLDFSSGNYYVCTPNVAAEVQSRFTYGDESVPASYYYENARGQKFLVFMFDGFSVRPDGTTYASYYRQAQLLQTIAKIEAPLPVCSRKNPSLWLLCKQEEDLLKIALTNFHPDSITRPVLETDGAYEIAETINCAASAEKEKITLSEIPAYGFAAVVLRRMGHV